MYTGKKKIKIFGLSLAAETKHGDVSRHSINLSIRFVLMKSSLRLMDFLFIITIRLNIITCI